MSPSSLAPRAWFQSVDGHGSFPLTQVIVRHPDSGQLLEVAHDMDELGRLSGEDWRRLFDERYLRTRWPYGSGVWGKKEWVAPHVEDANVVSFMEGGTNLLWAERYGRDLGLPDLWVKQCGTSHTGSFKDLGMTVLVSTVKQIIADGGQVRAMACASTGDTSAALAAYGAAAGIDTLVLLPRGKVSTAQLVQPLANGARVLALDTDFDGCMAAVQRLAAEEGVYLANSMNSLRIEGQKTVGIEIAQQFDWEVPDWVVIPGGNLGNVSALAAGFQMMQRLGVTRKLPRIAVAQSARANPLYRAFKNGLGELEAMEAGSTLASAIRIGNPVSYVKAVRALREHDGVVEQASEDELAGAAARADLSGMFNCPHTGVALAVTEKLVAAGTIAPSDRVVVISTASGLKFVDFKVQYHQGALPDVDARHANRPIEVSGRYDDIRDAVRRLLQA